MIMLMMRPLRDGWNAVTNPSSVTIVVSLAKNPAKQPLLPCALSSITCSLFFLSMIKHHKPCCAYNVMHHHFVCVRQHQDLWPPKATPPPTNGLHDTYHGFVCITP